MFSEKGNSREAVIPSRVHYLSYFRKLQLPLAPNVERMRNLNWCVGSTLIGLAALEYVIFIIIFFF